MWRRLVCSRLITRSMQRIRNVTFTDDHNVTCPIHDKSCSAPLPRTLRSTRPSPDPLLITLFGLLEITVRCLGNGYVPQQRLFPSHVIRSALHGSAMVPNMMHCSAIGACCGISLPSNRSLNARSLLTAITYLCYLSPLKKQCIIFKQRIYISQEA